MFGHPPLYPLPSREGTLTLDTLQLVEAKRTCPPELWRRSRQIGAAGWFITGMKGSILLANMEKLGIDPMSIEEVFISHAHFDHAGGLSGFLAINKDVTIYVPHSIRGVQGISGVVSVSKPPEDP